MSVVAPEGAGSPVPAQGVVAPQPAQASVEKAVAPAAPAPAASLKASHVVGGGFGGVVGAVIVAVADHFGWHVSGIDAAVVGSAALSAGVGFGHVIGSVGVFGAVKQFLHGRQAVA